MKSILSKTTFFLQICVKVEVKIKQQSENKRKTFFLSVYVHVAFLFDIVRGLCIMHFKQKKRQPTSASRGAAGSGGTKQQQ